MDARRLTIITLIVSTILSGTVHCQTMEDTMRLIKNLTANYDPRVRPVLNQSDTVLLHAAFSLISLQDFDDLTGMVTFLALTLVTWTDEKMVWDPKDYGNVTSIMLRDTDIWIPKLVMVNSPDHRFLPGMNAGSFHIQSDGEVLMFSIDRLQTICTVDVSRYPFDSQRCIILIVPWTYSSNFVTFTINDTADIGAFQPVFVENSAWVVETTKTEITEIENISSLKVVLTCTRRHRYTVLNLIVPILTLAFLNNWVCLLPPESGERTSYSITVLLSFVVYMSILNDNIPKGSEPLSRLTITLVITLFYSVSLLFWTIVSLRIYNNIGKKRVPTVLQRIIPHLLFTCFNSRNKTIEEMSEDDTSENRIVEKRDAMSGPGRMKAWDTASSTDTMQVTWSMVGKALDIYVFIVHLILWLGLIIPVYNMSMDTEL